MTDWLTIAKDILTLPEDIETPADAAAHRAWLRDLARETDHRDHIAPEREWKPTRTVTHK